MPYLHQCKQCGLLFERIENATNSEVGEFSSDRNFMVDKCNTCKNFILCNVFGYLSRSG
jgi:hypothetical protein